MTEAEVLWKIFDGNRSGYGTYELDGTSKSTGKKLGKATTLKLPVELNLFIEHLKGTKGVGIVPIRQDSTCVFGAIDLDDYQDVKTKGIIKLIEKFNLPLIPCLTKSGGLHLYLFTSEPVSASLMQRKLKELASQLGISYNPNGTPVEIFPKQSFFEPGSDDLGSWINIPYCGGIKQGRYAVDSEGKAKVFDEFIQLWNDKKINESSLEELKITIQEVIPDGPPCLNYLIGMGVPEGGRNTVLLALGVYLKKKDSQTWETNLEEINRKHFLNPLRSEEVLAITKSLRKKDYAYQCNAEPLKSYCDKVLCQTRLYGVGSGSFPIELIAVRKIDTKPPTWYVDAEYEGQTYTIECDTDTLQTQRKFQKACLEKMNFMPSMPKSIVWESMLNKCMENLQIIEMPSTADSYGLLLYYLEQYCNKSSAQTRDEIPNRPWHDEGYTYFALEDFIRFINMKGFKDFSVQKVANIIKQEMKAEHGRWNLKGRNQNYWKIKSFDVQTEAYDVPIQEINEVF